jgi:hypothetical protein
MRRKALLSLALPLAGCGDGGTAARFPDFVSGRLAATADDTDPQPINDLDFNDAASEEDLFAGIFD